MHLPIALAAATLSLHAYAFLIPPQIHDAAEAAKLQTESFLHEEINVYLDCPNCPFAGTDENDPVWLPEVENRIELEFRVDDTQHLTINEVPVFPLDLSQPLPPPTIVAPQIRISDGAKSPPIPVGCAIEIYLADGVEQESDKKLITAKFTILDLIGTPVKVATVKLDLLEYTNGAETKLSIVRASTIPFDQTPGADTCEGAAKWSLCRLRAIITARIQALVATARTHADAASKWIKKPSGGCKGRKFGKHRKEGKHHELHRGMHRFGHVLHQTLRFFVVPALLGVVGGLIASAVGMLVGQFIVYMWFRFRRNGERGPMRRGEVVLIVEDEKDGLLAEGGEAPPAYEDDVVVLVEDGKK